MKGTVELFNETKGFGFIKADDEENHIIVKRDNLETDQHTISEGQRVEFEIIMGERGQEAIHVKLI